MAGRLKERLGPRAPMEFPSDWSRYGPKMRALSERERRFVWAYFCNGLTDGIENASQAARDAGYAPSGSIKASSVVGHHLLHRERVLEAIQEVAARELRGLVMPAVIALGRILADREHADHRKAIEMVLNRTGNSERTEHMVNVEHRLDARQQEDLVRRLAEELGLPVARLLGPNICLDGVAMNGGAAGSGADDE